MLKIVDIDNITEDEKELIYRKCLKFADMINHKVLRECCKKIYTDYKSLLINKPATAGNCHHFYDCGLLFHIYCVTRNALGIVNSYDYIDVDKDLVLFGALLHDIGKTQDFKHFKDITDDAYSGKTSELLGHSYEGTKIVEDYLNKYSIDEEYKLQVLHVIGTHMRNFGEHGVLTSPKMLESIIINFADNLDSEMDNNRLGINSAKPGEKYEDARHKTSYYKSKNN